jgi:predicted O-linked N-acetylglucosamine transferase (SPINDLY family)
MTIEQAFQLATQQHQAGRLAQAEQLYRQILAAQPNHAGALHFLGLVAHQAGRADLALDLISRAIQITPNVADFHNNLGSVLLALRRLDEAIQQFHIVLQLNPRSAEAYYNLGNAYVQLNRLDIACEHFQSAIRIRPNYAWALANLGSAYQERGWLDPAMEAFGRALAVDPKLPEAHFGMGNVHRGRAEIDEAIAAYRRAIAIRGDHPFYSNLLLTLHLHPAVDAQSLLREHLQWRRVHADPLRPLIRAHSNDRDPDRRLRVGYVSPEFREHVVGQYAMPLLANHDHANFEIYLYSDVTLPDALTARFRGCADVWREVAGASDAQLAGLIRQDRIDVLIDLCCHLKGSRLLTFAQKPAPVQAGWLSYPSTSGLDTIDHRITDPLLDPQGMYDADYTEKSAYLDGSYWCYDAPRETAQTQITPLPLQANGYVTFGCLNNFCKVNDVILSMWAEVMNVLPTSRLILLSDPGAHRDRTLATFAKLGVEPARIEFVGRQKFGKYMQLYGRIDVMLDTFPYNGHTTSLDALWMGVPVVSIAGATCASRGGRSILGNVGLLELVADSPRRFVDIAIKLAQDPPRLAELRATLRERLRASKLCDAVGFARNMESLYRRFWRDWTGT